MPRRREPAGRGGGGGCQRQRSRLLLPRPRIRDLPQKRRGKRLAGTIANAGCGAAPPVAPKLALKGVPLSLSNPPPPPSRRPATPGKDLGRPTARPHARQAAFVPPTGTLPAGAVPRGRARVRVRQRSPGRGGGWVRAEALRAACARFVHRRQPLTHLIAPLPIALPGGGGGVGSGKRRRGEVQRPYAQPVGGGVPPRPPIPGGAPAPGSSGEATRAPPPRRPRSSLRSAPGVLPPLLRRAPASSQVIFSLARRSTRTRFQSHGS